MPLGFLARFHGFEGLRCRSFKVSQALGRQMSKVEEASGLIMRFQGLSWAENRTSSVSVSTLIYTSKCHPVL